MGALQEKFLAFCTYGSKKSETQLDGRSFVKLFRDAGILKKPLTQTDLDLTFAKVRQRPTQRAAETHYSSPQKVMGSSSYGRHSGALSRFTTLKVLLPPVQVKVKGANKISFQQFQESLSIVADKKVYISMQHTQDHHIYTCFQVRCRLRSAHIAAAMSQHVSVVGRR